VESQSIVAVEALGRHLVDGQVHSLGPFFLDRSVDPGFHEYRWGVDRALRAAALREFVLGAHPDQRLFLNVNPQFMLEYLKSQTSELPWTLQTIEDLGIDPRRVVIELTEQGVGGATASLRRLVDTYRAHGCSIAVDDVGAEASNLDRIGYLEPDIVKIDATLLRRSLAERSFEEVLVGLRAMADGLGAALLFEGVESERELTQALRFGARYLQGWYFGAAEPTFAPLDRFAPLLKARLEVFGQARSREIVDRDKNLGTVISLLSRAFPDLTSTDHVTLVDPASLEPWTGLACRVFLTDRRGFQVSPNYVPRPEGWVSDGRGVGSCRTARPYFAGRGTPNRGGARLWSVSEPYFDVNDRTRLRTFGRLVGPDLILFVDVPEIEYPFRTD